MGNLQDSRGIPPHRQETGYKEKGLWLNMMEIVLLLMADDLLDEVSFLTM